MNNETKLDAPPDGLSHNELLLRLDRQDALATIRADQEHEVLRGLMVEKYGLERVEEVEQEVADASYASHNDNHEA